MILSKEELQFRWKAPEPDDPHRRGAFGDGVCVSVAVILDDQVIARVYEHVAVDEDRGDCQHSARLFNQNASSIILPQCMWALAQVMQHVEDHLFGVLRNWISCSSCNALADVAHSSEEKRMRMRQLCHACLFWSDFIVEREKDPNRFAIVEGRGYSIGEETAPSDKSMRGFGGQRFVIKRNDGTKIVTTNLWHRGEVPLVFRDRLPEDATFGGRYE